MEQRSFSKRMMTALFPTLNKGVARPITTYHLIKHAPATSHKNQVNSYMYAYMYRSVIPQRQRTERTALCPVLCALCWPWRP